MPPDEGRRALALQILGGTSDYGAVRSAGSVDLRRISLTLPAGDPTLTPDRDAAGVLGTSGRCLSRRVITLTLRAPRGARLRSARVTYAGRRAQVARVRRWHARIDLRGTRHRTVRVRILVRTRSGRTLRETRTYRTCTPKRRR